MSRMLSKMNLISVVQQLPKEDIETIQGYVEMIEQENDVQKVMIENFVKENQELKAINEQHRKGFNLKGETGIDFFTYDPNNPAATLRVSDKILESVQKLEKNVFSERRL